MIPFITQRGEHDKAGAACSTQTKIIQLMTRQEHDPKSTHGSPGSGKAQADVNRFFAVHGDVWQGCPLIKGSQPHKGAPEPPTSHPRAVSSSEEEPQAHKEFIEEQLNFPKLVSSSVTGNDGRGRENSASREANPGVWSEKLKNQDTICTK